MEALAKKRSITRRSFLGWSIGGILAATVVAVTAPSGVYLFTPQAAAPKRRLPIILDRPVADVKEGEVSQFAAPQGLAFVMADGGEANSPGDPTFGGFLTRQGGVLRAFAITCPHLGCSYAFDTGKKHFVCPCHGSEFGLDGHVIHGPATSPLSHLTWSQGPNANEIDIEGVAL